MYYLLLGLPSVQVEGYVANYTETGHEVEG